MKGYTGWRGKMSSSWRREDMKAAPRSGVTGEHQVHTQPAMNVISHEHTSQKGFSVQWPLQLECLKINHYMRTLY